MAKRNEFTASQELALRAQASGWKVGKNFAAKKPVAKKQTFLGYLKNRGIIGFRQSAKTE